MSKQRVGRNPFEKKSQTQASRPAPHEPTDEPVIGKMINIPEDKTSISPSSGLITKLLIELPAEAYMLSLKARMIARTLLK